MSSYEEQSTQSISSEMYSRQPLPAALLRQLLTVTAVSLVFITVLFWISQGLGTVDLAIGGVTLLLIGLLVGLIHRGRVVWAANLYMAALWLAVTAVMVVYEIYRIPSPGVYFIIVLGGALLLQGRAALIYALISFVAAALIIVANELGRLPLYHPFSDFQPTLTNTYPKALVGFFLLGLAYYSLRHTLATLRFNKMTLQEIEDTLGRRTTDLSMTNERLRHEISERKQTEAALEQQRSFLRQIIDTIPHFVFVKDSSGIFTTINKAMAKAYNITPADFEGQSLTEEASLSQEIDQFDQTDQAVLHNQEEKYWPELRFADRQGLQRWLQLIKRPLIDEANDTSFILGIASDITLIKETTEALRLKEAQFRTLVEASFDGLIICINQIIIEANANFATMFGYSSIDAVIGQNAVNFLNPESGEKLQQFLQEDGHLPAEMVGVRLDNTNFPVEVISRHINYQGEEAQISGFRDISTRKNAQQAQEHAKKLEGLTQMAGGLAHDFNNLLVALMGQMSLAKAKMEPGHASQENLDKAMQASEQAALLTRQLLAFTGQGHFELISLDLNSLMSENLETFQQVLPSSITLHTNLHEQLEEIEADRFQLQQIVMNLLFNARDAIGDSSGSITIRTAPYSLTEAEIPSWQQTNKSIAPGDFIMLEVVDTGRGMDEPTLSRIFDPFFSTKSTGRGLGLAAVLGVMRGHKGSVRALSQIDQGTAFQMIFPVALAREDFEDEETLIPLPASHNMVLVIDDERQVREAIGDILDLDDIAVITAADGQEGVALFEANQAEIGLIILDLSMPGMSGMETFAALREIDSRAKIILSSGYTETEILQKMAGARPTGFLQKPYRLETVLHTVEKYLH